ncbi:MAG TPA: Nif3-like dinuclear metal center hexameric protein [Burkholderiaceae bacterium]|nr:Nif3-like dinuclear metal center hexameric protein [Burkholderiaceae bacterium]
MTDRQALLDTFNHLLQPERFTDYGPNGLQVEGKARIRKIISGVTASRALIEAAIADQADAIFVHHGLFWRGQTSVVTGWMRERLKLLLAHDINLYAYHLPLDAHPTLGNNAQLGQQLGLIGADAIESGNITHFGEQELGWMANTDHLDNTALRHPASLLKHLEFILNRPVSGVFSANVAIKKIAWCSGGAQSYFEAAIQAGADAFITGEISEPQAHLARECGVAYFACGHHATERYGAPALAAHVAANLGLEHQFIEIDNPA